MTPRTFTLNGCDGGMPALSVCKDVKGQQPVRSRALQAGAARVRDQALQQWLCAWLCGAGLGPPKGRQASCLHAPALRVRSCYCIIFMQGLEV